MTKDGLRMFSHKPVLGWGLGTFTTVYPQFRSFYTNLLELFDAHPVIQLVLLDYAMPGMDGLTLAREMKKRRPFVPIFMVSAHEDTLSKMNVDCVEWVIPKGSGPEFLLETDQTGAYASIRLCRTALDRKHYGIVALLRHNSSQVRYANPASSDRSAVKALRRQRTRGINLRHSAAFCGGRHSGLIPDSAHPC